MAKKDLEKLTEIISVAANKVRIITEEKEKKEKNRMKKIRNLLVYLLQELPDWGPTAKEGKEKEMKKIITDKKEDVNLRLDLIEKMQPYDIDEVPEFKEVITDEYYKDYVNYKVAIALIKKMQPYDPTQFPEFIDVIEKERDDRWFEEQGEIIQALARQANPEDIEKLPLERKVLFWYLRGELKEKLQKLGKEELERLLKEENIAKNKSENFWIHRAIEEVAARKR